MDKKELREQLERLDESTEKLADDTREDIETLWQKSKKFISQNKLVIGLSTALVLSLAATTQTITTKPKEIQVIKEVVKPVEVKTVVKYGDEWVCYDSSSMYDITKEKVKSNGMDKIKHARGLELPDGYSLYVTEFTPVKEKK